MIIIMELVESNEILKAHLTFYKALLASKFFDFSLILYFRFILYDYIKQNETKYYLEQFPVLIGNLLPSIYEKDGVFDFNSFYNNYLLKMFIYAEKIIIYLTPFVLGINLDVVLFDDNENEILKHFIFVGEDILKIEETIFLINKKGHYENVFNYDDNKNFNYIYQYYRNDIINKYISIDPNLSKIYKLIKNYKNQEIKNNDNNDSPIQPIQNNNINNDNTNNNNDKKILNNNYLSKKSSDINNNVNKNNVDNNDDNKNNINNINNNLNDCLNKNINNTVMKNNFFEEHKKGKIKLNKNMIPKSYRNQNQRKINFNTNQQNYFNYYTVDTNYNAFNIKNTLKEDFQSKIIYNDDNQGFNNNNKNEKVPNNNNKEINIQNKCNICSSLNKYLYKDFGNICQECLFKEIKNQSKAFYVKYLEEMNQKINEITVNDLNNYFINKIEIYIDDKVFNIHTIFDELHKINLNTDKNQNLKYLLEYLKLRICLYCFKVIKNNDLRYKIPCGCNFCSRDHLEYFFRYIVGNSLTCNYKCLCAYQYKPSKVLELCILLNNNKIYHNNQCYIEHLESIFNEICCKCSCTGKELLSISVDENSIFNFIHKICCICLNLDKNNNNKIIECIICNKQHQYIPVVDGML